MVDHDGWNLGGGSNLTEGIIDAIDSYVI